MTRRPRPTGTSRSAYADCLIAIARHARRAGQRVELEPSRSAWRRPPCAAACARSSPSRRHRWRRAGRRVSGRSSALLLLACLTATPVQTIAAFRRDAGTPGDDPFRGFAGTFVVRDDRGLIDVRYNAERADLRFSPCSTFKLPFAVMFLESGIVRDPETVLKYEPRLAAGPLSAQPGTAHDQTLTSAFHESANWYFDTVSRSLDRAVVEQFTARSGYGNADVRDAAGGARELLVRRPSSHLRERAGAVPSAAAQRRAGTVGTHDRFDQAGGPGRGNAAMAAGRENRRVPGRWRRRHDPLVRRLGGEGRQHVLLRPAVRGGRLRSLPCASESRSPGTC